MSTLILRIVMPYHPIATFFIDINGTASGHCLRASPSPFYPLRLPIKTFASLSGGQIPRSLLRLLAEDIVAHMSDNIHQSHNVSVLMYHLVCPAKYRRVVFDASVDAVLKEGVSA